MDFSSLAIEFPNIWNYLIIPLLICIARITDVTIGSIRIVFLSKGLKKLAPILGFFEVIIWLLAISQVMKHMDNWLNYVAYGLGFALGNYFGIVIEEKISLGNVLLRVITRKSAHELVERFQKEGYRITHLDAEGVKGTVKIFFTIVKRKQLKPMIEIIKTYNPDAIYSVEDVRQVSDGALISNKPIIKSKKRKKIRFQRKGK